jgi:uncharacterized protein (TIGR01244 family)
MEATATEAPAKTMRGPFVQDIGDKLAIAGELTADELRALSERGYRVVVDLRSDGEPTTRGMTPWDERRVAAGLGLTYRQVPIEVSSFDHPTVETVRRMLRETRGRVLLHCRSGRRAAALAVIYLSCDEHLPLREALGRARALGVDRDGAAGLCDLWMAYVVRHRPHDTTAEMERAWSV